MIRARYCKRSFKGQWCPIEGNVSKVVIATRNAFSSTQLKLAIEHAVI